MTRALSARQVVVLVMGVHLCLTVFLANALNLWIDEAYTLHTTGSGLAHGLRQAISFELQPPAFYVLLSAWRKVDPGLFFSRLFSVVCVAMAIPVAAMAWTRYRPRIHPGWIAAALAFNPGAIWAAVEARPYGLSLLVATGLLWLFGAGFLCESPRPGRRAAYAVLALLALYTQYYLGFLLAGGAAALVVAGRWHSLRDYVGWMLLVLVGFMPLLLAVPGQVSSHTGTVEPLSLAAAINYTLAGFEGLVLSTTSLGGGRAGRWLYRGTLAAVIVAANKDLLTGHRRIGSRVVALLVISLVVAGFLVGVQLLFGTWVTEARHMLFVLPAVLLLLYGVSTTGSSLRPVVVVTLLLLSSSGYALYQRYEPLAKHGDHARVAQYLGESVSEGEPILVFPGEQILALNHYFRGHGPLVPLPVPPSLTRYDLSVFVWRDREHVVRTLHDQLGSSDVCWLVTYGIEELLDLSLRSDLLEAVVESGFEVLEHREFQGGALVRQLRVRDDPKQASGIANRVPTGAGVRVPPPRGTIPRRGRSGANAGIS